MAILCFAAEQLIWNIKYLQPHAIYCQKLYLEKSSGRLCVKVQELLKRRSVMLQRCRSWLLSDGVSARCSVVRQRNVQCSQMVTSWLRSLWKSGWSMNFDLVVSRLSSDPATRLHIAPVLRFLASSENCNNRMAYDSRAVWTELFYVLSTLSSFLSSTRVLDRYRKWLLTIKWSKTNSHMVHHSSL